MTEHAAEKKSESKEASMAMDKNLNKFMQAMFPSPSPGAKPSFAFPHAFGGNGLDTPGNGFLQSKTPISMNPGAFPFQGPFDASLLSMLQNFSPTEPRRESHEPNRQEQPPQSPSGNPWGHHKLEDISPMFKPPAFKDKMPPQNLNLPRDDLASPFKMLNPLTPNPNFELLLSAMKKSLPMQSQAGQKDYEDPAKSVGLTGGHFDFNLANLGLPLTSPGLLLSSRGFIPGPLDSNMGSSRFQAFTFDEAFDDGSRGQANGENPEKKVKKN
mgnify:CR=1 FL=1